MGVEAEHGARREAACLPLGSPLGGCLYWVLNAGEYPP